MPEEVDIYAYTTHDPQFGWRFIDSFLRLGKALPSGVYESALLRTYSYARFKSHDPEVLAALSLENAANLHRCILVRCLLLLGQKDDAEIARLTGLPEKSVDVYESLFWSTRHRDDIDRNSLVYPGGRQVEFLPGYAYKESIMYLALRAAVQHGMSAVEELLGIKKVPMDSDVKKQAGASVAQILSTGNFLMKLGFGHQELPALSRALRALKGAKPSSAQDQLVQPRMKVGQEGRARTVSESLMRITGADRPIEPPTAREVAREWNEAQLRFSELKTGAAGQPIDSNQQDANELRRAA